MRDCAHLASFRSVNRTTLSLSLALALLLCACRSHPCDDEEATPAGELAELPLIQEGGKVCFASTNAIDKSEEATLKYWGDSVGTLTGQYVHALDAAGWGQRECGPFGSKDLLCFEKAGQTLYLTMTQTETPRMGSKMMAPSITVNAHLMAKE